MTPLLAVAEAAAGSDLLTELAVFALAAFVGFYVISNVPNTLHTPLMSATNAIHGIVLLGAVLVIGATEGDTVARVVAFVAIVFGSINVVGGFFVTDRMLEMFKRKPARKPKPAEEGEGA